MTYPYKSSNCKKKIYNPSCQSLQEEPEGQLRTHVLDPAQNLFSTSLVYTPSDKHDHPASRPGGDIYTEPFQPINQHQILTLWHLVSNMTSGSEPKHRHRHRHLPCTNDKSSAAEEEEETRYPADSFLFLFLLLYHINSHLKSRLM